MQAKWLTAKEVAEVLQLPISRVYELARSGLLPVIRIEREVRFPEEALHKWLRLRIELCTGE